MQPIFYLAIPHEGIDFRFQAKQPGPEVRLNPVEMEFRYSDAFGESLPEAYETLLVNIMQGDAMLFMRADQIEEAWRVVMPILQAWDESGTDLSFYAAGTWGPELAVALMAQDGRRWA